MRIYHSTQRVAVIGESSFDEVNIRACAQELGKNLTIGKWGRGLYFDRSESSDAHSAFARIFGRKAGRYFLEKAGFNPPILM